MSDSLEVYDRPRPDGVSAEWWAWAEAHDRFIAAWRLDHGGDHTGGAEAFRQTEEHARLHAAAYPKEGQ
ncbi:hypothetical protein [Catenuloplanes japonicus]|uniref:hypothetical protein n=1 Tax=Catenuloplanes japonicus TaxID=33876 RepID=UPI00052744D0|nr:hypothetical protein [Catenuloplanes japonicus]